jgi:hypothetical protein
VRYLPSMERCDLIIRVNKAVASDTESVREQDIGVQLSYLFEAIATGNGAHVYWGDDGIGNEPPILTMFRKLFEPNDPVWDYITQ